MCVPVVCVPTCVQYAQEINRKLLYKLYPSAGYAAVASASASVDHHRRVPLLLALVALEPALARRHVVCSPSPSSKKRAPARRAVSPTYNLTVSLVGLVARHARCSSMQRREGGASLLQTNSSLKV